MMTRYSLHTPDRVSVDLAARLRKLRLAKGWVVGSAAPLLAPAPLTTAGRWIVFAVALVVADVAYFQLRGFLGLRQAAAQAA